MALEYDWRPALLHAPPGTRTTEILYDARDDTDDNPTRLRAERDEWRRLASFADLEYRFAAQELARTDAQHAQQLAADHARHLLDLDAQLRAARALKTAHAAALRAERARLDAANADIAELVDAQRRRNNARNVTPAAHVLAARDRAERMACGLAFVVQHELERTGRVQEELVHVQEDLARVRMEKGALERRLEDVDEARARDEEEHRTYVRALAAEQKADLDAVLAELDQERATVAQLREMEAAVAVETEQERATMANLRARTAELEQEHADLRGQLEARDSELSTLRGELATRADELAGARVDLAAREHEREQERVTVAELRGLLDAQGGELASSALELEVARADLAAREQDVSALRADLAERRAELDDARAMLESTGAELVAREEDLAAAQSTIVDRDAQLAARATELASARAALDDLAGARAALGNAQPLLADLDVKTRQLEDVWAMLDDRDAALKDLRAELDALRDVRAELDATRADLDSHGAELAARRQDLAVREAELRDAREDLYAMTARFEDAAAQLAAQPMPALSDLAALENALAENAALSAEIESLSLLLGQLERRTDDAERRAEDAEGRVERRNAQIGLHQRDVARLETNLRLAEDALEELDDARAARETLLADADALRGERDALLRRLGEADARAEEMRRRLGEESSVAGLTAVLAEARRVDVGGLLLRVPAGDVSRDPVEATENFDFDFQTADLRHDSLVDATLDFAAPTPRAPRPSTQADDGHAVDDTMDFVLSGGRAGALSRADEADDAYDFLELRASGASAYSDAQRAGTPLADSVFTQGAPVESRAATPTDARYAGEEEALGRELFDARAQLDDTRAQLRAARERIAVLEEEGEEQRQVLARARVEDATRDLADLTTRRALRDELDALHESRSRARDELAAHADDVERLRREVEVGDALLVAAQAELARREAEAAALVGVIVALRPKRPARPTSYMSLSELVVVPRGDETQVLKIGELRDQAVAFEQEVIHTKTALAQANDRARAVERELDETKGALLDARTELLKKDAAHEDLAALKEELTTAQAQSADIATKLETLASHLRGARMQLDSERKQHRKKVLELEIAGDEMEVERDDARDCAQALQARVEELEGVVAELEGAAAAAADLQARVAELEPLVHELRVAEEQVRGVELRASEMEVLVGELEARRDELLARVGELEHALDAERAVGARMEVLNGELERDVVGLQRELAMSQGEREKLEQSLGRMDDDMMALRARIMDKDTELAGLSAQLHRAQLVLEEAQEEAAGRAAELQGCLDAVAAQLRTKEDEAEEADDRLIEALKEKKRQEGRADALARKVLALEEKVKQIAQQVQQAPQDILSAPCPGPSSSVSAPQLQVRTASLEPSERPMSATASLESSGPILVRAPSGGPPPMRAASSPAVIATVPILSRPPSGGLTPMTRQPPSATVPALDLKPRLLARAPSSTPILHRAPSPGAAGTELHRPPSTGALSVSSSRAVSSSSATRPVSSARVPSGSQPSRPPAHSRPSLSPRPPSSASPRLPSDSSSARPPPASTAYTRRPTSQSPAPPQSPRRPSVAAAAARTDVRSMAAALSSAPSSSNPRKRPAPEDFDQSLVLGALPVAAPASPPQAVHPPVSQRRGFTPKRSSAGRPILAAPSPIAPKRFGADATNNVGSRPAALLGRSWLAKMQPAAAPPESPAQGRVEAMRAKFAQ